MAAIKIPEIDIKFAQLLNVGLQFYIDYLFLVKNEKNTKADANCVINSFDPTQDVTLTKMIIENLFNFQIKIQKVAIAHSKGIKKLSISEYYALDCAMSHLIDTTDLRNDDWSVNRWRMIKNAAHSQIISIY